MSTIQHHVFLSYSRRDAKVMRAVREILQTAELRVWTDEGIEPGTPSWQRAIEAAIRYSGALVCILSPDSAESRWVHEELNFARINDKPIFLVLARGSEQSAIPFGFATSQWIDIRESTNLMPKLLPMIATISARVGEVHAPDQALPDVNSVLPHPFEWCTVDAGSVILEDASDQNWPGTKGGEFWLDEFYIAKYPITIEQFAAFAEAPDGYCDPGWWEFSGYALAWRIDHPDPDISDPVALNLPHSTATWFEAVAFTRWLSSRLGQYDIMLPTEQQWQRAAQSSDNRTYPWGDQFNSGWCNTFENGQKTISPVTAYPEGASPYGVMDMAGNVYEWCLTRWHDGANDLEHADRRVIRGGTYEHNAHAARCSMRVRRRPEGGGAGFRIVYNR